MPRPRILHKTIDNEMHKYCNTCDKWIIITNFSRCSKTWDKLDTRCKTCNSVVYKTKAEITKKIKQENARNKIMTWLIQNKNAIIKYSKTINEREHWLNIEKIKHKIRTKHIKSKKNKERKKIDIDFLLRTSLRLRIAHLITRGSRTLLSQELVGCSLDFLRGYLEAQFQPGMSWENYGQWHIDHIVPCNYFDLSIPSNQYKCFNYRNLQPLWSRENISKGDKLTNQSIQVLKILEDMSKSDTELDSKIIPKLHTNNREKQISMTLKQFNQTELGKEIKKLSLIKRSETMKKQKDDIRATITNKTCSKCGKTKNIQSFSIKNDAKDGYQPWCCECVIENKRVWRAKQRKL